MDIGESNTPTRNIVWERYIGGDKNAFNDLYAMYHDRLLMYCVGFLKDFQSAEDAVSQIMIRLLEQTTAGNIRQFENWLYTVARNTCLTMLATVKRRENLINAKSEIFPQSSPPDAEAYLHRQDIEQIITQHLSQTDARIWNYHTQGFGNEEIAQLLDMDDKTVANRKSEVRKKLKILLKNYPRNL